MVRYPERNPFCLRVDLFQGSRLIFDFVLGRDVTKLYQAEKIAVKRFIKGQSNETRVRV